MNDIISYRLIFPVNEMHLYQILKKQTTSYPSLLIVFILISIAVLLLRIALSIETLCSVKT